jgi:hypothetical protein
MQMVRNNGDIYGNYSGVPNSGKSTQLIRDGRSVNYELRHYWAEQRDFSENNLANQKIVDDLSSLSKFSLKKNVLYKPESTSISDLLGESRYNVVCGDEGYLFALNLMAMDRFMVEFIQTINISRSKNNFVGFCFQNMERAIKALKERFNIWVHKPRKERAYLFARSNLFITKDPWHTKRILDAIGDESILYELNNHPDKVMIYKTKPLKPQVQALYDKLKSAAHMEIMQKRQIRDSIRETQDMIAEELFQKIKVEKSLAYASIPDYLRERYQFDENQIKGTMRRYLQYEEWKKVKAKRSEEAWT